jgi:vacuolar-type H+-ATPase subunit E/Vma4
MASFDPLWKIADREFTSADASLGRRGLAAFSPHLGRALRSVEEPASVPVPTGDSLPGAVVLEPEPYDPASDGWIRVEEHQESLERAGREHAEEARAELLAELDGRHERLGELVTEFERLVVERFEAKKEVLAEASEAVAELVLALSRRVVGETLAVHPRSLRHLVLQAMERLPGEDAVQVRVRPEDLPVLEAHTDSRRPITWVPDLQLEGGIVVQTDLGQVAASLEIAFTALDEAVSVWLDQQRS